MYNLSTIQNTQEGFWLDQIFFLYLMILILQFQSDSTKPSLAAAKNLVVR